MGKHKKKVREEKTKTKLKGSILPKGLNVTKTEFKVKKIVLREQIRTAQPNEIQSSRNINIKECTTRLQHHNASFRTEALRNLKEIVNNFPDEVVAKYLNDVIVNVSKLALDVDRDIRRESFKVLGVVLAAAPSDYVRPFFDVLSSYARCAMTHIQPGIQEDSLLLVDTLITNVPLLISSNSDKLFASFLNMMSKFRSETNSERTVTINLGNKQTSSKWRNKILERLFKMLEAIIHDKINSKRFDYDCLKNGGRKGVKNAFDDDEEVEMDEDDVLRFKVDKSMHFPLIYSHYNRNCYISKLFTKSQLGLYESDEGERIKHYVSTLMPLLIETWLEVRPTSSTNISQSNSVISIEAAFTLKIILEIMDQLWNLMKIWEAEVNNDDMTVWFRLTYGRDFVQNFVEGFPYIQGEVMASQGKKKKSTVSEKEVAGAGGLQCLKQNFAICFLFSCTNDVVRSSDLKNFNKIIGFVNKYLENWDHITPELSAYFLKVVRLILIDNGLGWTPIKFETVNVLKNILKLYANRTMVSKNSRDKIMVMLCDIVLNEKLMKYYGENIFIEWIPSLTKMLVQPHISEIVLKTFSFLAKQSNKTFLDNLNERAMDIMKNLSAIKIIGVTNQFEGKKLLANLFFWMSAETVLRLSGDVDNVNLDSDIKLYLNDVLSMNINK